jgi:hypothetical protein
MNEAQMNEAQMNEAQMNNRNELWKKQSSSCLFICHGARPFPGGRTLSDPWGAHSKTACCGRAPSQESAPLLRRARPLSWGRPFQLQRALLNVAHRGRALSQESALLLRRACPFSGGHALLAQWAHSEINQAKIRHNFAWKMNAGARGLGHNLCIKNSLSVLFT